MLYVPSFPLVRFVGYPFYHWFLHIQVTGEENLPEHGGFLLYANHASYLDPLIVGFASRRREIAFMAKQELFHVPFFAWILRGVGAFPVRRGTFDEKGIERFFHYLSKKQKPILVFPEGTRTLTGEVQPFKRGAGFLALQAEVPVHPVWIEGTFDLWPKGKKYPKPGNCGVHFGEAVDLGDLRRLPQTKETYARAAQRIREAVLHLKKNR